jgi:hypothetical protein
MSVDENIEEEEEEEEEGNDMVPFFLRPLNTLPKAPAPNLEVNVYSYRYYMIHESLG